MQSFLCCSSHGPKDTKLHTITTSTIRVAHYYRQFSQSYKDTKLHTIPTNMKWTSLYYGQFPWSDRYQTSYNHHLYNTDSSPLRTVPLVPHGDTKIHTIVTFLILTPIYYGSLSWSERCQKLQAIRTTIGRKRLYYHYLTQIKYDFFFVLIF